MRMQSIFKILMCISVIPVMLMIFLPVQPEMGWQFSVLHFISQKLHIQTGISGPLPLYTLLTSAYFSILSPVWAIYMFWLMQQEDSHKSLKPAQFRLLDSMIVFTMLIGFMVCSFYLSQWHFSRLDMTTMLGRNGYLFQMLYQYKLGIIFCEIFFMLFLIASELLILMGSYAVYDWIKNSRSKR